MFSSLFIVLLLDALLIGLFMLAIAPLAFFRKAAFAVLKRNFVSYFTTPVGYVFLCLFVLLSSFAAFWPHEFWSSNMATLDQLNFWIPLILLLFIPAITMSIWAEERRQGTDELLLTIPADDFDIVLGKYLSAASIFTASLLFSQLANFSVLNVVAQGGVDLGLFFTTYIGYWFMGMAMLSIGMVASFLTKNLTVGFILGALFNAPLAVANYADVIFADAGFAQMISRWGMATQFAEFGRGMITISAVTYFSMIIVTGIYLSVVLIGRRHWLGGKDGHSMLGHYLVRAAALIVVAVSATIFFTNHDFVRIDTTSAQINALSPETRKLLSQLDLKRPIKIEAYISKTLPDEFVRTRYELISMLKEVQARGGTDIQVAIHDNMDPYSPQAKEAEDQYGIRPVIVQHQSHGAEKAEQVFLAAAFTSGPERVVVPFIGPGTPIEYELIQSISRVARGAAASTEKSEDKKEDGEDGEKKKPRAIQKIGIMRTDAQITGGFSMETFSSFEEQPIVSQLRRQYEVEDIDPNSPVDKDEIDVLMVVQPSSLTPTQLPNVLDAIRAGIPTAIFEDPAPVRFRGGPGAPAVPGTDEPKRAPGGMFGMQRGPQPKCDIQQLWDLLGVRLVKAKMGRPQQGPDDIRRDPAKGTVEVKVEWEPFTPVIYQKFNPYLKIPGMHDAVLFANPDAKGAGDAFNSAEPAVEGMHEVLFLAPGAFEEAKKKSTAAKGLNFSYLVKTGTDSGMQSLNPQPSLGDPNNSMWDRFTIRKVKSQSDTENDEQWMEAAKVENLLLEEEPRIETDDQFILAARVTGKLNAQPEDEDEGDVESEEGEADDDEADEAQEKEETDAKDDDEPTVDVILVADIDMLERHFMQLRDMPPPGIDFQFQIVPFVLNVVDTLAGDDRFLNIRKRTTHHASLKEVEQQIREAMRESQEEEDKFKKSLQKEAEDAQMAHLQVIADLEAQKEKLRAAGKLTPQAEAEIEEKKRLATERDQRRLQEQARKQIRRQQAKQRQIERDLELDRRGIQNWYKGLAVILPPLIPMLVGVVVFIRRWMRENEGVSQTRRR